MEDITRQDFEAYLTVQESGIYNMLSEGSIQATGLPREKYFTIITYYSVLRKKYENNELPVA